jgi:hypothetical protein
MSNELSSLTLEDIRETLSSAPDVLPTARSNQEIKNLTASPWTISKVTGSTDFGYTTGSSIRPLTTSEIGSLTSCTIGPYTYTNNTGINTIQPGNFSGQGNFTISNTKFEQNGKMVMKGAEADIEINGKSMRVWMEKIEQRLNILTPNPDMEKEWDQLRRLGERYRKLEKKCQEKSQMWNALKKMPPLKL